MELVVVLVMIMVCVCVCVCVWGRVSVAGYAWCVRSVSRCRILPAVGDF